MSLTKVTYSMIDNAEVNVSDYGAVGDGVANNQSAFTAAFTEAVSTGKTLRIPAGNYLFNDRVSVSLTSSTKGLSVVCDPGVVLIKSASFPADKQLFLILAASGNQSVSWVGGTLDGRLAPVKTPSTAPDLMSINGGETYIKRVYVSGAYFLCNDTRAGTAGDSCLFVAGCDDVCIVNNKFQGATDLGLYISGQTSFVGERIYVAGNTFIECINAIGSKRDYKSHIIDGNFIRNCDVGIFIGGEVGFNETAKKAVISNNVLQYVIRGIEARICDGTSIIGNRVEDYGINSSGVAVGDVALFVDGSNNCVLSGNVTLFSGAYVPDAQATAVRIADRTTPLSAVYTSKYNLIIGNSFKAPSNVTYAVREVDGSDYNIITNNIVEGFLSKPPYTVVGANSNYGQSFTVFGPDPYITVQDNETTVGSAVAGIRLGESDGSGNLNNYFEARFNGPTQSAVLGFGEATTSTFTTLMSLNYATDNVNFEPQPAKLDAQGVAGDVYYNSTTNKLQCHNGTSWQDLF